MAKFAIVAIVGLFVLFYIITSPDQAANMVHGVWHGAVTMAHGIGHFFDKLAS